ncbi:Vitamin K epoxide reductase [Aeromicrobium sp. SMF47]|uniref:Vitamin K epoxide reductase n=1 Tax=Aeromicrobium yanjiei TaxID=2662028 RepID=A0A5Q2MC64_9ACTN|nr:MULTISPECIES: vitamin K epoxide reductase family protein [Aeromicrobium]MRJ78243.1 Vitamin K epoxide reductase [Aeromicrobium yanjiei]MRK03127.1 Vitamin K epoxide reductase [Aeromicrobium sp. S22]QGG40694.1 Vitamin K epoxide reductase [Aeromicrobium yanjiei]
MTDQRTVADSDVDVYEPNDRGLGWLLALGGAIGMLAAAILIIDKVKFLQEPDKALGCDINAFVSCGGVINTDQASVFGFPNPLMGVAGFAIVMTLGVLIAARVRLPDFVWLGLQAGAVFGIAFVTWLQSQSIYSIEKLCPWCMVVWSVMIPIFVWLTARNLREFLPGNPVSRFVNDWTLLITILWYVAVLAAIWFQFGSDLWA